LLRMHFDQSNNIKTILLADDDIDDRDFFSDALKQVSGTTELVLAENGIELMNKLHHSLPGKAALIFLDLNMPLKNGYECLAEIKQQPAFKHLPVIIFSTSLQPETVNNVYRQGASLYIVKPNSFNKLKDIIKHVLSLNWSGAPVQPSREKFILQS